MQYKRKSVVFRQGGFSLWLTANISAAKNDPPPPFLPFSATMAPGNMPCPPTPRGPRRTLTAGSNRRGTRAPEPIMREDSSINEASFSLTAAEDVSESRTIRPTTTTSSCTLGEYIESIPHKESRKTYLCDGRWVPEFLNIVVSFDELAKMVNPIIQH